MQFTTVRSKEKDYDIYLKSEKLVHRQQEHEKNVSQLFRSGKNCYSYFEPNKHCCSYLEREKSGSLLFGDQKMQFTTLRSKEKDYEIYLKSENLVHSQQEHDKNVSQLFGIGKNQFLAISSLTNTVSQFPSYLEAIGERKNQFPSYFETKKCSSNTVRSKEKDYDIYLESGKTWFLEKSGSLLFGDQKMQFTTVRSKEKDYNFYLKSEKLVHRQQEHEKNVSQLFGSGKNWSLAISSLTNTVAAIWREKKVDPCYLETKKCSSQLLGARKKIMTSI